MENYNFWRDFFDTYQSLSNWMKVLWLVVPPAFLLVLIWLAARTGEQRRSAEPNTVGRLIYSVYRDEENCIRIFSHLPELADRPNLLFLDPPTADSDRSASPAHAHQTALQRLDSAATKHDR